MSVDACLVCLSVCPSLSLPILSAHSHAPARVPWALASTRVPDQSVPLPLLNVCALPVAHTARGLHLGKAQVFHVFDLCVLWSCHSVPLPLHRFSDLDPVLKLRAMRMLWLSADLSRGWQWSSYAMEHTKKV